MHRDYLRYIIGSKGALRDMHAQDKLRELHLQILACIYRKVGEVSMPNAREIAQQLTYHQNLMYKPLAFLEDNGYVDQVGGGRDADKSIARRSIQGFDPVIYTITSKGVRAIEKYEALIEKYGK